MKPVLLALLAATTLGALVLGTAPAAVAGPRVREAVSAEADRRLPAADFFGIEPVHERADLLTPCGRRARA